MEPAMGIDLMKLALYKAAVEDKPEDYYMALRQQSAAGVEDDGLQVMPNGNTVLHVAALHGRQHFVENILRVKDNNHVATLSLLFAQNKKNESALHCAAEKGHANIVSILISATNKYMDVESSVGVRKMVEMTDNGMDTALHKAVRMRHLEVVKFLVEKDNEFVYPPNNAGETPIYLAARLGFHDCLQQLLNTCKYPTYGGPLGRNALHATTSLVSPSGCKELLLMREISLCDITDDSGWSPLHYAIKKRYNETARMILARKSCAAYICAGKGDEWTTVFHIAARYGNVEMMKYISNNCFPDCWMVLNSKSQNVLHEAVLGHRLNAIEYVLKNIPQADNLIEGKDEDGNNPLALLSVCSCNPLKRVAMQGLMWKHLVFNKQHQTPFAMAFQNRKCAFSKFFLGWKLVRNGGKIGCQGELTANRKERKKDVVTEKDIHFMVKTSGTNIIAASLILTVTFTAGLTVPGGYNSNPGKTQGTPLLLHNPLFMVFLLYDFLAFFFSIMSILFHIVMVAKASSIKNYKSVARYFALSKFMIMYAVINAVFAFMFGIGAPLPLSYFLNSVIIIFMFCVYIGVSHLFLSL